MLIITETYSNLVLQINRNLTSFSDFLINRLLDNQVDQNQSFIFFIFS